MQDLAKKGMLVLRLSCVSDGSVAEALWFHISYANFKTWVAAVLPLLPAADVVREIQATAGGYIALDLAEPMSKTLGANHWWAHLRNHDFTRHWDSQLYCLRDDEARILGDAFVPAEVEVRSLIPIAKAVIWAGTDEIKPGSRKKETSPRFDKGAASSSRPRQRPPAGSPAPPPRGASPGSAAASHSDSADVSRNSGEMSDVPSLPSALGKHDKDLETDSTPRSNAMSDGLATVRQYIYIYIFYNIMH